MLPSHPTIRKRRQYGRDRVRARTTPLQQKYNTDWMHESLTIRDLYRRVNRGRTLEQAKITPKLWHWWSRFKKVLVS